MKLATAIKKLENANYKIETNGSFFLASKGEETISFTSNGENAKGFTYDSNSQCSPTTFKTLSQAMA